jgi:hypothetical protein
MESNNNFSALILDRANHLYCGSWKYCAPDQKGNPSIPCQDQKSSVYSTLECQKFRQQQNDFRNDKNVSDYLLGCYNNTGKCAEAAHQIAKDQQGPYKSDQRKCDPSKIKYHNLNKQWYDFCLNYPSSPYCYEHSIYKYKYEDPYQRDQTVCYTGDDPCGLNCDHMSYYKSTPSIYADKCCPGNKITKDPNSTTFQPIPDPSICQSYTPCYDDIEHNLKYYCGKGDQKDEPTAISVTNKEEAQKIGQTFYDCIPYCGNRQRFEF